VDAVLEDAIFRAGDLRHDRRWPNFGRRAADEAGINSMLAIRLYVEDFDFLAGLNLYAHANDAFEETTETIVTILATHAALAIAGANARARASNLEKALDSNREIGVAMGVLMAQHKITREQAFGLLRLASQNSNRKLADIAGEVADTGVLRPTPARRKPNGQAAAAV
jgi:GAF domain-containing protein